MRRKFLQKPIEDIDPDRIVFNISKTPYGVKVIWRVANNNADPQCFNTEVQYKRQCEKDWERSHRIKLQNNQEENHLNLSTLSTKMNYDFRIRMKYECLEKDWSNWTKVQSWGNNKDVCMVKSSYYIWVYILIIMLPLITFLLFCLLIQQSGGETLRRGMKIAQPQTLRLLTKVKAKRFIKLW
ncbi:cytokine receptor-like factor 2 isoform X4 [Danio rerio]|uniref:Cytokine receptor-like factor 2 isoform X4 n=1 Tax=Danio rerio TaxID=7955 RepID=A0AC58GCZ2_DANRE